MFFATFVSLCKEKKVSKQGACLECGMSRTAWNKWRDGSIPSGENLQALADYFHVTTDYLLTGDETKRTPPQEEERIPHERFREVIAGPGIRIQLDADASIDEERLKRIVDFIRFQQELNGR